MAEHDNRDSQQRDETVHPENPPRAVVEPNWRKTPAFAAPAMWYYLGPIALMLLVVVFAIIFLATRDEGEEGAVPTTGIEQEAPSHQETPGGFDPVPQHDETQDELDYRGAEP